MKTINSEWLSYLHGVVPHNASQVQITETQRAFYAGAWSYFIIVMDSLSNNIPPTLEDVQTLIRLRNEVIEFLKESMEKDE